MPTVELDTMTTTEPLDVWLTRQDGPDDEDLVKVACVGQVPPGADYRMIADQEAAILYRRYWDGGEVRVCDPAGRVVYRRPIRSE